VGFGFDILLKNNLKKSVVGREPLVDLESKNTSVSRLHLSNVRRQSILAIVLLVLLLQLISPFSLLAEASGTTQRMVLAELFTATWCGYCPYAVNAINELAEEYKPNLVVLQYHPQFSDPFGTSETEARISYYGVTGFPTMIFDGTQWDSGGSVNTYNSYKEIIENKLAVPAEVTISFTGTLQDFTADIAVLNTIPQTSVKVRFVVYEKDIPYDAPNGEKIFTFTVRTILDEETVNLSAEQKVSIKRTFQPQTEWELKNMGVAVFVQKDDTHEVLQAATFPSEASNPPNSSEFSFTSDEINQIIKTNEIANFTALLTNSDDENDTYTITTQKSLPPGWEAGFCLGTRCYWDSATLPLQPSSSYPIDAYIVAMNVTGTGNLTVTITSENDPSQTHSLVFTANVESLPNNQESTTTALALVAAGIAIILAVIGLWVIRHKKTQSKNTSASNLQETKMLTKNRHIH
jgi:thiol-disulfide isomerase/thioredoxin